MEITKRKFYKHYTYVRKQNIPVVELESLIDKSIKDKKEQTTKIVYNILSRIDFDRLGRVNRILSLDSGRRIISTMELQKIIFEILTDAIDKFLLSRDVAFYDNEYIGICIFAGKNGKHGIVIYPKLDLPK
jgi:hypothetical protein